MELAPFKVAIHRSGESFFMARGAWRSEWRPINRLPETIAFYAALRDRNSTPADPKHRTPAQPGPYAEIYAPCVTALEQAQAKIRKDNK